MGVATDITFNGEETYIYSSESPQAVPARPSGKGSEAHLNNI
jgi:hypothetical protein